MGEQVDSVFGAAPLFDTDSSWVAVAAVVVLIVVLLVFSIRQGNGHTGELFHDTTTEHVAPIVQSAVAKNASSRL